MKTLLTLLLLTVCSLAFGQTKSDTVRVTIPARQLQKLQELEKAQKELEARKEDILLDLLAVPENEAKAKGKKFVGIKGNEIKFINP